MNSAQQVNFYSKENLTQLLAAVFSLLSSMYIAGDAVLTT